ncbi:hypothetical protein LCGC14_1089330 [marine sediment metagenome]|uniref:Uncharacterized protein n=1 Tax=marine sediment metagenome TaxID=412755 RepID=A0A0F9MD16_9ZZZZ
MTGCTRRECLENHDRYEANLLTSASVAYNRSGEVRLGVIVGRYSRGERHDGWLVSHALNVSERLSRVQHAYSLMVIVGGEE